jgi:hypothetical protein
MRNIQWGDLDRQKKVSVFWQYITAGVFQSLAVMVIIWMCTIARLSTVSGTSTLFFFILGSCLFAFSMKIFKDIEA